MIHVRLMAEAYALAASAVSPSLLYGRRDGLAGPYGGLLLEECTRSHLIRSNDDFGKSDDQFARIGQTVLEPRLKDRPASLYLDIIRPSDCIVLKFIIPFEACRSESVLKFEFVWLIVNKFVGRRRARFVRSFPVHFTNRRLRSSEQDFTINGDSLLERI